jgi:hypothetical protein
VTILACAVGRLMGLCRPAPRNAWSRALTPREAEDFRAKMEAHGVTDDDDSRDTVSGSERQC